MSYVYFARADDGQIKIGVSGDPARRIECLRATPIGCIAGDRSLEAELHLRFSHLRSCSNSKEWFNPEPEILNFIQSLDLIRDLESISYGNKVGLYDVPAALWTEIKVHAVRSGVTTSQFVVSVLASEVGFDLILLEKPPRAAIEAPIVAVDRLDRSADYEDKEEDDNPGTIA